MANVGGLGRLGVLAVGLGIGAAVASTPMVASADSSTDPFSWISGLDLGDLPAQSTPTMELAISIDGILLVRDGTANANTGNDDIAIAIGAGAYAVANDGTGNFAYADGSYASADAGVSEGSNNNTAIDIGNNTNSDDGPTAYDGNNNTAIDIGNNSGNSDGPTAGEGSNNSATEIGNNSGNDDGANAFVGNGNTVDDDASYSSNFLGPLAGNGDNNLAIVDGDGSTGYAGGYNSEFPGNSDILLISGINDIAGAGGTATSPGSFDIATLFGDFLSSFGATGGDYLN